MVMYELIKGDEATAPSKPNNELSNVVAAADNALLSPHEDDIEAGVRNATNTPQEKEEAPAARGSRLVSLDVFRGLTVAVSPTFLPHCFHFSLSLSSLIIHLITLLSPSFNSSLNRIII